MVCAAFTGCIAIGCIFDTNEPSQPLSMYYLGNSGDTLNPMPVLKFAFSDSINPSLDFSFSPPVAQEYFISFCKTNDTAALTFTEMLPGNTRYVLKLHTTVTAGNDPPLSPGSDSIVFVTARTENEPNDSPNLADTVFAPVVYGVLNTASDTDFYIVPTQKKEYYFESAEPQTDYAVFDSLLRPVTVTRRSGIADTFTIARDVVFPIYISVSSSIRGMSSSYKLGVAP